MKKYKWILVILNLLLLSLYFVNSVQQKERILKEGKLVLLELAPVDPRSLMQGDYMQLRYNISNSFVADSMPKRGYCVVRVDQNGVAGEPRFQQHTTPLNQGETLIEYTSSNGWNVHIGAESFFFQEGQAKKYDSAKYGAVKVDGSGNSLLIGLYDKHLQKLN